MTMTGRQNQPRVRRNTAPGAFESWMVDAERRPLGTGEREVIQFRGSNRLTRDSKSPENTAELLLQDAWTTMQDLGMQDDAGRVLFVGRQKDRPTVAGKNGAPQEIDVKVSPHPAVKLVQVVGISDDRFLGVHAAFVGLVTGSEAKEEELIVYRPGRIASFTAPQIIRFVADGEWPTTTKIQRFVLGNPHLAEPASIPAG